VNLLGEVVEFRYKGRCYRKNSNRRKLCYDRTLEFLREGKTLQAQPSVETRQKEYAPRLTRRGNCDFPAHFSSILSFYGAEMLCLVSQPYRGTFCLEIGVESGVPEPY
jgi:hypothetical protein